MSVHEPVRIREPSEVFSQNMVEWLATDAPDPRVLGKWLAGYGVPGIERDGDAWHSLVTFLEPPVDRRRFAVALGRWLASLETPATTDASLEYLEQVYNALALSSALKLGRVLSDPLNRIFDQRLIAPLAQWRGIPLQAMLRLALANTQIDTRLRDVWLTAIENDGHPELGGTAEEAFQSLLIMRDEPDMEAIARGLAILGRNISDPHNGFDRPKQKEIMKNLLKVARDAHPDYDSWDAELMFYLGQSYCPPWVMICLDHRTAKLPLESRINDFGRDDLFISSFVFSDIYLELSNVMKGGFVDQIYKSPSSLCEIIKPVNSVAMYFLALLDGGQNKVAMENVVFHANDKASTIEQFQALMALTIQQEMDQLGRQEEPEREMILDIVISRSAIKPPFDLLTEDLDLALKGNEVLQNIKALDFSEQDETSRKDTFLSGTESIVIGDQKGTGNTIGDRKRKIGIGNRGGSTPELVSDSEDIGQGVSLGSVDYPFQVIGDAATSTLNPKAAA